MIDSLEEYNYLKTGEPYSFLCKNCNQEVFIKHKRTDKINKERQMKLLCKNCMTEQTTLNKYGVKSVLQLKEIRKDEERTLTQEEFVRRAKEIHGDKYDYSLVEYKNNQTKVKIVCKSKYHKNYIFYQTPHHHLSGEGCHICNRFNCCSTEQFIEKAKEIHGDKYDYSLVKYVSELDKVKIICPIHGCFEQSPRNHIYFKYGCKYCKESKGEKAIRNWLNKNNISFNCQVEYGDLKDKLPLSYDFFVPSVNLLIEYNGTQHYKKGSFKNHNLKIQRHHDWLKRKYAKDNKINLLVIPYWEFNNIEEILGEKCQKKLKH